MNIDPIAYIRTDFSEKFGIPRQSGLATQLQARIVFEPEYRNPDLLRGLEDFSHIWLIWEFSANQGKWQSLVRPPRLGGNKLMGVFATRSPFRPNPIGLSCVELVNIEISRTEGPVIYVKGADLMDGTPVYDIKPYISYADSRSHARCGYVENLRERQLKVVIPASCAENFPDKEKLPALIEVLKLDPRPSYHDDPDRVYGMSFAGRNIKFSVMDDVLTVSDIE